jgi:sugar/nucleoside kinase (ribokinase family)
VTLPRCDVLGLGQISIDHVGTVDGLPPLGGKAGLLAYDVLPGGQIATAVLAAARLGLRASFVGAVGTDPAAELVIAPLVAAGVDVGGVQRVPGAATRLAFVLVDRASGERTVLGYRDPRLHLRPPERPVLGVGDARCLLVDAEDPEASCAAAEAARRAGIPIVADVDAPGTGVEELLANVDFPLVSRSFAESFGLDGTVRSGLRRLVALGAKLAVATLGERGSLALAGDREIAAAAYPIAPRDTTGAGDVFHAAFAWGLLEGFDEARLLGTANAAAALSCRGLGAQGGLPTRPELEAFLREREPGAWRDPDEGRG